jgi:hypothetical protein
MKLYIKIVTLICGVLSFILAGSLVFQMDIPSVIFGIIIFRAGISIFKCAFQIDEIKSE